MNLNVSLQEESRILCAMNLTLSSEIMVTSAKSLFPLNCERDLFQLVSKSFHLRLNFSDMIDAWISWLSHTKGFNPNTNVLRATKIEKCKTEILNLLDLFSAESNDFWARRQFESN